MDDSAYDVAIVGGGPGGSTCASFLKKFMPDLKVLVLEREAFPRDHVGESQLPPVSRVLHELGCWEKVEAAGFPIKIGATYKWGRSSELWDFQFIPSAEFVDEPRPAAYRGQRTKTAFQVDRGIYDKILLDHAASMGAEIRQPAKVVEILREGDRVMGLKLEDGSAVTAKWYVDATGHSGLLRRAMGVEIDVPTSLQNIAIWDYWENAEWAVDIGVGGTRVQVMSLGYGWLWFIPISPTRTSIGLVIPASTFKKMGRPPQDVYREAVHSDPVVSALIKNATSEGRLSTTKDWSFLSKRMVGENWFLVGEAAGFADPILAAGLTLTQVGAKELAYTILELVRGKFKSDWIREEYELRQTVRLQSHIRFADYWYTSNGLFKDLKEFTAEIASFNGLELAPDRAWAWLAQGGFIDYDANLGIAGFTMHELKNLGDFLGEVDAESVLMTCNRFKIDLDGAEWIARAVYVGGGVSQSGSYVRDGKYLPMTGSLSLAVQFLHRSDDINKIIEMITEEVRVRSRGTMQIDEEVGRIPHALEAMASDGWIKCSYDPNIPLGRMPIQFGEALRWNRDNKVR